MTILESPLFKHHKPIKEKAKKIIEQEVDFLTEQFIKSCFTIPIELEKEYTFLGEQINDMPFKPELEEWITCPHRLRRYIEGMGVLSFCTNPFHPGFEIGLWNVECLRNNCDLEKISDDPSL